MPQMTRCVSIQEASKRFSAQVGRVRYGGDRVVITSRGKPAAALVSVADLQRLEQAQPSAKAGTP
jgi:prevent-host-death family protein